MSAIHDSNAIYNKEKMLIQHQAILTLIQKEVGNPEISTYRWLDLGCGKGQLITNLESNFSTETRAKIIYSAYDVKDDYVTGTVKIAEKLGFQNFSGKTGDILDFPNIYNSSEKFEFISLTNAVHELSPGIISQVLFEAIIRLENTGLLFMYDMEELPIPELGAITWSCLEMKEILKCLIESIPVTNRYFPETGQWQHHSCNAWNVILHRGYLGVSNQILFEKKETIIKVINEKIRDLISRKLKKCSDSLDALTKYGPETESEEKFKMKLLFDYWALNRFLNGK